MWQIYEARKHERGSRRLSKLIVMHEGSSGRTAGNQGHRWQASDLAVEGSVRGFICWLTPRSRPGQQSGCDGCVLARICSRCVIHPRVIVLSRRRRKAISGKPLKTGLDEVPVKGERPLHAALPHHDKRNTVSQGERSVGVLLEKGKRYGWPQRPRSPQAQVCAPTCGSDRALVAITA